jgi:6-phosphogluconolactonase
MLALLVATLLAATPGPLVYVSGADPEIQVFRLDLDTGALAAQSTAATGSPAGYLAFDRKGRALFGVGKEAQALAIDRRTGALSRVNEVGYAPGKGPAHITVHPSGRWVLLAHYGSGHVSVHPVAANGSLGEASDVREVGKMAHMVLFDGDRAGKYVFVPCKGSDWIAQLVFDAKTGKLAPQDPPTVATEPGAEPRHIAFHRKLPAAYVINEKNDTVTSYHYDRKQGLLSDPQTLSTLPAPDVDEKNSTAHVLLHPNGRFLYGSNRGHDSIAIYAVDAKTGRLTFVAHETGGGGIKTPRNFTIDPSGRILIVANQGADTAFTFRIHAKTGLLTKLQEAATGKKPSFVGLLP